MPSTTRARLGAIHYWRGFDVDDLLLRCCENSRSRGLRVGGLVQKSSGPRGQCSSSVHVVDLGSGQAFDIWEDRGACARGCRLDEHGLLDAEPAIMAAVADGVDLVIINRFGRAESLGRGLIGCFIAAAEAGVPVLTAVREPYDQAWSEFHDGFALALPLEIQCIVQWCLECAGRSPSNTADDRLNLIGVALANVTPRPR